MVTSPDKLGRRSDGTSMMMSHVSQTEREDNNTSDGGAKQKNEGTMDSLSPVGGTSAMTIPGFHEQQQQQQQSQSQQQQQQPVTKQALPHPLLTTPSHSNVSSVSNAAVSTSRGRLYRCLPGPGVLGAVVSAAELLYDNDNVTSNETKEAKNAGIVGSKNKLQAGPSSSPSIATSPLAAPNSKPATPSGSSSTQQPSLATLSAPSKLVTREIAALDFLMNIPLRQERDIVRAGVQAQMMKDQHELSLHYQRDHLMSGESSDIVGPGTGAIDGGTVGAPLGVDEPSIALSHEGTATTAAGSVNAVGGASTTSSAPTNHLFHLHWWERLMGSDAPHKNRQRKIQQDLEEEKELEKPNQGGLDGGGGDLESNHNNGGGAGGLRGSREILPVMVQGSPDHRALLQGSGLPNRGGGGATTSNIPRLTAHNRSSSAAVDNFFAAQHVAPGRRLNGIEPVAVVRPPKVICNGMENFRKISSSSVVGGGGGRSVAINSAVREWEVKLAHGIGDNNKQQQSKGGLLDGRSFFSMQSSYPLGVFSVIRYEPKKEEAARRRKKLEEMGGGGTQFVLPVRDWRGVSYAALLKSREGSGANSSNNANGPSMVATKRRRRRRRPRRGGNRSPNNNHTSDNPSGNTSTDDDDDDDDEQLEHDFSSSSSGEDGGKESNEEYQPGFLDDPAMVQGKHRHVMVGDKVTGPIVSSVIQFVDPVDLKKDLNKQFRDRFDGWEPPSAQRKYIGAKVVNGLYTLIDPTVGLSKGNTSSDNEDAASTSTTRKGSSLSSPSKESSSSPPSSSKPAPTATATTDIIRMPPSLTLSKIRSLKNKILRIGLKAQLELSTVALSFVYFERLCLDCRVDKSNRHLSFAACLLLAYKTNEPNVAVITTQHDNETSNPSTAALLKEHTSKAIKTKAVQQLILQTFVRPAKKSVGVFTSLLDHLTNDFSLSLKHLFAAEWGVFVALGFKLHAKPSQVAFHFRRILKVLERSALSYLGDEMYGQWQQSLNDEAKQKERHEERRRARRERKERKLLKLQRKAIQQQQQKQQQMSNHNRRRSSTGTNSSISMGLEIKTTKGRSSNEEKTEPPLSTAAIKQHLERQAPLATIATQGSSTRSSNVPGMETGEDAPISTVPGAPPWGASPDAKVRRAASLRNKLTLSGLPGNTSSAPTSRSTSLSPTRKILMAAAAATAAPPPPTTSASHSDDEPNVSLPPLSASHGTTSTTTGRSPVAPVSKLVSSHPRRNSIKGWAGQIKHLRSSINPAEKIAATAKRGATPDDSMIVPNSQLQQHARAMLTPSPQITGRKQLSSVSSTSRAPPPRSVSPGPQGFSSILMSRSSSSPHLSQLESDMTEEVQETTSSYTTSSQLQASHRTTNRSNPDFVSRSTSLPPHAGEKTEMKDNISVGHQLPSTTDLELIVSSSSMDEQNNQPSKKDTESLDDIV